MNPLQFAPRLLSRFKPTLISPHPFPGLTLIHRMDLAREVLQRHEEFSVAHQGARIAACFGPAMLGMPDGDEYRAHLQLGREIIERGDVERLRSFLEREADAIIDQATVHKTTLNLVADYLDPLCLRYLEHYFGIPDPGHGVLLRWYRMTSHYVFNVYITNSPGIELPAQRAGRQLLAHVTAVVRRRSEANELDGDDLMSRLLRLRLRKYPDLSDVELARRLVAISSGGVVAPFSLTLSALDKLLDLPSALLAGAREAARHADDAVVLDYAREAARFNPVPLIVSRFCEHGATLAPGTQLERRVPKASLVVINLVAVHRDASALEEPEAFRPGRPESERMLYGHALHHCFAAHIGEVVLTAASKALLRRPVFERVRGPDGRMQRGPKLDFPEGVYPMSLNVRVFAYD
jgi:cytochrome P450